MPGEQNLLRSCEICGQPAAPEPTTLEPGIKTTDQYGREILTRRIQAWYCPAHRQRVLKSTPTPAPPPAVGPAPADARTDQPLRRALSTQGADR